MKTIIQSMFRVLPAVALILLAGCEYDGPTAVYYQPYSTAEPPIIESVNPAEATGGVNLITIHGANFSSVYEHNKVYIDGAPVDITEFSTTSLSVRRPNASGDSTVIKVVNTEAAEYAEYSPYRITSVYETFGGFIEGNELTSLAVDRDENVYVVQSSPRMVFRISPEGERTEVGDPGVSVTDAVLAPDGDLVLLAGNRRIYKMDLATGVSDEWYENDGRKRVAYGDFDQYGNFYTGGSRTDLFVLHPDMTEEAVDQYSAFEIYDVRVYDDAVYVLAENTRPDSLDPVVAVWKNPITGAGTVGEKELVLDWADTGVYADSMALDMTFTSDRRLIIATNSPDPLFVLNLDDGSKDVFYKDIIPPAAVQIVWGVRESMYMIQSISESWDLLRIDMGAPGAPYYGR